MFRCTSVTTRNRFVSRVIAVAPFAVGLSLMAQSPGAVGCDSNIISSTVVATYCGHADGSEQILDLLILWRGDPGWFERGQGGSGSGGTYEATGGVTSHVTQYSMYGGVAIGFEADFDKNSASVGETVVQLDRVNTVLVDNVDKPGARAVSTTLWTEPRLPLSGDVHVALIRQSSALLDYLRCDLPMPGESAARSRTPRVPVVTVCEKLKSK